MASLNERRWFIIFAVAIATVTTTCIIVSRYGNIEADIVAFARNDPEMPSTHHPDMNEKIVRTISAGKTAKEDSPPTTQAKMDTPQRSEVKVHTALKTGAKMDTSPKTEHKMIMNPTAIEAKIDSEGETFVKTQTEVATSPHTASSKNLRIHCMIFTSLASWLTLGKAVEFTWAKRCYRYTFFYTPKDNVTIAKATALRTPDGSAYQTDRTYEGLNVTYSAHGQEADWILKSNDDVYIIWENLIKILSQFDSSKPHYVGRVIKDTITHGYNSGRASYVLSRPAARILYEDFNSKQDATCVHSGGSDDRNIGTCLASHQVFPEITLDSEGFLTFHSDNPLAMIGGNETLREAYFIQKGEAMFGNQATGEKMLSLDTVSFYCIRRSEMYTFDFLLYELNR